VRAERPLGPVICDLGGTALTVAEAEMLGHPLVGGVILFARNYDSPEQLRELCAAIHRLRQPPLLVAADQEGGRVQRFVRGFTRLPPMRALGRLYERDAARAASLARAAGEVLAGELLEHGVDLSFAPVLDIDFGASAVIGDRAFHSTAAGVATLAGALLQGMRRAGMGAVAKHFPGHGWVRADSHHELPVDERDLATIAACDLEPYRALIGQGLAGVMAAHVIYARVDPRPAGFSPFWLQEILRTRLGFDGVVFSDDLSMAGARAAGGIVERARAALDAGCDMVLVCNDPAAATRVLDGLRPTGLRADRVRGLRPASTSVRPDYRRAAAALVRAAEEGLLA
jgi:beta-N-acetylhexosaminidase